MQIRSVPLVLHYPPTEGPHAKIIPTEYETYDLQRRGPAAEDLGRYIEQVTGTKVRLSNRTEPFVLPPFEIEPTQFPPFSNAQISISRPTDYSKLLGYLSFLSILLGSALFAWRQFSYFLTHRLLWSLLSTTWIALMTSGFMWNQIRHPPWTGVKDGKPEVFAGGFQNQYGLETQIVMLLCGCFACRAAALARSAPPPAR